MSVAIVENDDGFYTVILDRRYEILTTVTSSSVEATRWVSSIYTNYRPHLHHLLVGLDVEWRPNFGRFHYNAAALLQLCVGRHCLVFQLLHADSFPASLRGFLLDHRFSFVGVGVAGDAEKLLEDHRIEVGRTVDLRGWAADATGKDDLRQAGMKRIARAVMGIDVEKPARVRLGRWDNAVLNWEQIKYACVDAFLSFEIARSLYWEQCLRE